MSTIIAMTAPSPRIISPIKPKTNSPTCCKTNLITGNKTSNPITKHNVISNMTGRIVRKKPIINSIFRPYRGPNSQLKIVRQQQEAGFADGKYLQSLHQRAYRQRPGLRGLLQSLRHL